MADVTQLINDATQRIDETMVQADAFLADLLAITNVQFSDGFNIDQLIPNSYNYASVPTVDFPVIAGGIRPTVTTLGDPAPEAPTLADIPALQQIVFPVDDLLAPTHNFEFFEAAYQSTLLDPLKAKLLADLTNGGYGIDVADEQALYQRARDRETDAAMSRIDEAGRTLAARGFMLPPGELSIQIDRSHQELQDKLSSASREIFINSATRFVENRRFTIEQVKGVEQILIGFHNSVQERALNAARAAAEFSIVVYNALLARYRARLEATKIASDVQLQRMQAEVARNQAALEMFRTRVVAYEASLRRAVETTRAQVDLYQADIAANRNLTDGLVARTTLQQRVIEATVQQNIQISNLAIENAKAKLLATVEAFKFRAGSTQFAAGNFYALVTAMMNTINTLAVQTAEQAA